MVKRRFVKEIIHFGTSLGIVVDKTIRQTLNVENNIVVEDGDMIVFDVVRIIKRKKRNNESS